MESTSQAVVWMSFRVGCVSTEQLPTEWENQIVSLRWIKGGQIGGKTQEVQVSNGRAVWHETWSFHTKLFLLNNFNQNSKLNKFQPKHLNLHLHSAQGDRVLQINLANYAQHEAKTRQTFPLFENSNAHLILRISCDWTGINGRKLVRLSGNEIDQTPNDLRFALSEKIYTLNGKIEDVDDLESNEDNLTPLASHQRDLSEGMSSSLPSSSSPSSQIGFFVEPSGMNLPSQIRSQFHIPENQSSLLLPSSPSPLATYQQELSQALPYPSPSSSSSSSSPSSSSPSPHSLPQPISPPSSLATPEIDPDSISANQIGYDEEITKGKTNQILSQIDQARQLISTQKLPNQEINSNQFSDLENSHIQQHSAGIWRTMNELLNKANEEIAEGKKIKNEYQDLILELNSQISEKDLICENLKSNLEELELKFKKREKEISSLEEREREMVDSLHRSNLANADLAALLQRKDEEKEEEEKREREREEEREKVKEKEREIAKLEEELARKEKDISQLEERENEKEREMEETKMKMESELKKKEEEVRRLGEREGEEFKKREREVKNLELKVSELMNALENQNEEREKEGTKEKESVEEKVEEKERMEEKEKEAAEKEREDEIFKAGEGSEKEIEEEKEVEVEEKGEEEENEVIESDRERGVEEGTAVIEEKEGEGEGEREGLFIFSRFFLISLAALVLLMSILIQYF